MKKSLIVKNIILIFALSSLFLFPFKTSFAQFPNQYLSNFWEILDKNDHYYDSLISLRGLDNMKGTGFKQYMRFKSRWQNLVPPSGNLDEVYSRMVDTKIQLANMKPDLTSQVIAPYWYELGPKNISPGPENGRLSTLALDPDNENIILAASGAGGLFYSIDGGFTFQNAGTDKLMSYWNVYRLTDAVSSVVISRFENKKYWFIATGDRDYNDSRSAGVYRSGDMGLTWELAGNSDYGLPQNLDYKINKLITLPGNPQVMLAATNKGLYRTSNAFDIHPSWQKVYSGEYFDIVVKPEPTGQTTNLTIYASSEYHGKADYIYGIPGYPSLPHDNLLKSLDNGLTWQEVTQMNSVMPLGHYGGIRINLEVTPADPDNLYVYISTTGGTDILGNNVLGAGYIYKYNFSDNQITLFMNAPTTGNLWDEGRQGFAISPSNKNEIYLGCIDLYKLVQSSFGPYWQICEGQGVHQDIHEIVFNNNGTDVWCASDGGLSKRNSGGYDNCNWINKSNGIAVSTCETMDHSPASSDDYLIGCWDTGADIYRKDLNTWKQISGNDIFAAAFDLTEKGTYYVCANVGGVEKFENYTSVGSIGVPENTFNTAIHIIPNSKEGNKIYQTSFDYLYRSYNRGSSWEKCTPRDLDQDPDYVVFDGFTAPSDGNVFYLRMLYPRFAILENQDQLIFKTKNINAEDPNAVSWAPVSLPEEWNPGNGFDSKVVSGFTVDEIDPNKFWVASPTWGSQYKVFKYENDVYTDVSKNLGGLNLSIKCIVHKPGSDDGIFVGTDFGVFYTDNTLPGWGWFSFGLPEYNITNLRIDDAHQKLIASIFGRGLWETNLDCTSGNGAFITIQHDETWSSPLSVAGIIVVPAGRTLTIRTEVYLGQFSKIIVDRGGKLVLDGGTLTNACNSLWKGIEVIGTSDQRQYFTQYQGIVEIINNGTISNAECGVRLVEMSDKTPVLTSAGGIIRCKQAIFKNNKLAVDMYPYRNFNPRNEEISNVSYFKNVQFITDDSYLIQQDQPTSFVRLNGVKTIQFLGCSFINSSTISNIIYRGTGIFAFSSAFIVDQLCTSENELPCTSYLPSTFSGLFYGIRAMGDGALYHINVDHGIFSNNLRGAYFGGLNLVNVNRNTFKTIIAKSGLPSSGLYLDHCSGYSVQENHFIGNPQIPNFSNNETGLVVNNSGESNNEIYNNNFVSLTNGITLQDKNRNKDGTAGLVCKCNDYDQVTTDLNVFVSNSTSSNMGIALNQGDDLSISGPAGNTFSLQHTQYTGIYSDITNNGAQFNYYHHRDIMQFRLKPTYYLNVELKPYYDGNYTKETACPSKLNNGGGVNQDQIKDDLASTGIQIEQKEDSLASLVDGGNTIETTEDIALSSPPEALDLRDALLLKSPFLSDTVMQAAVAKEYVLPNAMVRDILVANPQSATSDPVLDELDKRIDPMPADMYNQILDGKNSVSPKESKEAELSSVKANRQRLYNSLLSYYMADTTGTLSDSLDQLLRDENKPETWYLLACKQLFEGNITAAGSTLAAIPVEFDLSPTEILQHENYLSYFAVVSNMMSDTLPGNKCDSLQSAALTLLMQAGYEPVCTYARNLLIVNEAVTYNEPYLVADELKSTNIKRDRRNVAIQPAPKLTLNPNPCRNFLIAGYTLDDKINMNAILVISTLQGFELKTIRLVKTQDQVVIPLANFNAGNYIASLKSGGKLIDSKKIIVVK